MAIWGVVLAGQPRLVAGSPAEEARAYHERATAAFALGRFPEAAEQFEKAFELKPDPALLYNAAQSHRLAGNKERALALYQSYVRVYASGDKRAEAEARVRELKLAIENDRKVATTPPTSTQAPASQPPAPAVVAPVAWPPVPQLTPAPPPASAPPVVASPPASSPPPPESPPPAAAPPPPASPGPAAPPPAVTLVAQPEPAPVDRPVWSKAWFWITLGAVVAAGAGAAVFLATREPSDPNPSLGTLP